VTLINGQLLITVCSIAALQVIAKTYEHVYVGLTAIDHEVT
jgi:hypothetical protein